MTLRRPLPSNENSWVSIQQPLWIQTPSKNWNLLLDRICDATQSYIHNIYNINVNIYTYIAFILVGVSISSSKFFPKGPQQHIQGFQTNLFFFGGWAGQSQLQRGGVLCEQCWEVWTAGRSQKIGFWELRLNSAVFVRGHLFCSMCPWGLKTLWWN